MSDVFLEEFLTQKAVYWPPGAGTETGQPSYEDPVEINCRWDDSVSELGTMEGYSGASNAKVMVDREVEAKGVLWLGVLQDLTDSESPFANPGAYEIKKYTKTPNVDGDEFVRVAWL